MEEEKNRSYGDQRASIEENIRIEGNSQGQQGTLMQQKQIKKEKEIKCILYIESRAI